MSTLLPVVLIYAGIAVALLALCLLARPLAPRQVGTRFRAALVLGAGILLVVLGWAIPAERRVVEPRTRHDTFAPVFQFSERHWTEVRASRERVDRAIRAVTADEIAFFRTLIWLRRLGQPGPESILNPDEGTPLLDVATRTTFLWLADEPGREMVVGTLVVAPPGWRPSGQPTAESFRVLSAPGFAKATMNFLIEDAGNGVIRVTTETRVHATDPATQRAFARYWRVIYPGSALIRRMWLRAIRLRAERQS